MSKPVIKIENLVKRYKDFIALDHFNIEIREGEIFGLLGPNGSGKTTTINCILSLLSFDKGSIEVFGETMRPDSYDLKRQIGIVMQNVAVFDTLTVYENIDYFCGLYIKDKRLRQKYVEEAISFVELEQFRKFYPKKLSGGLLRRLNIACGIAHKPKLIILDEPTVAVDPQSRNKILEGIVDLNKQGATIIYTSHYMEEVNRSAHGSPLRTAAKISPSALMDSGKKKAVGTSDELKQMIKKSEQIKIEVPMLSDDHLRGIRALAHVSNAAYSDCQLNIQCTGGRHNLVHILEYLQQHNLSFDRVYSELPSLNDVFISITG